MYPYFVHTVHMILLEQYACDPGFSLFYRIDRAGPNEPIHLREKSYASRDSQGINNLLHPKMFFLEDLQSNAGMTVPRVRRTQMHLEVCMYCTVQVLYTTFLRHGGRILIGKGLILAISQKY